MRTTITMTTVPEHIHEGSTLRIDGRGWVEVISRTRTELEVIPVGALRSAVLEFNYALDALLRELGFYRLLDWLENLPMRLWKR